MLQAHPPAKTHWLFTTAIIIGALALAILAVVAVYVTVSISRLGH